MGLGPPRWRLVAHLEDLRSGRWITVEGCYGYADLRAWVDKLVARFGYLYADVVSACWYRHPGHVEALTPGRPPTSLLRTRGVTDRRGALHRAFRNIEARLRAWTAVAGCTPEDGHHTTPPPPPVDENDVAAFVADETATRPPNDF
jgi:hypothetical protein